MKILIHCLVSVLLTLTALAASSTVPEKEYGYTTVTILDRGFFQELRKAVLADDATRVAELVYYPITIGVKDGEITIRSSAEFTRHYREIVPPAMKELIRQTKPEDLWKNWQGVMIGNGAIWFDEIKPKGASLWVHKIITINFAALALNGSQPTP